MKRKITLFLSAGEPSGDFLSCQLMKALRVLLPDTDITFVGVGGPLMASQGLKSLFPFEELSIMGLLEIIPHIFHLRRRIQQTVLAIETLRPDAVITIDSPGFNFRVGKALRKRGSCVKLIHYGAPSVWAWRPGRAKKVAQFLDHLLALFPFEPPYFLKEGLPTTFVGHPVVDLNLTEKADTTFRARQGIDPNAPLLTVLPGSRMAEVTNLLPIFKETVLRLQETSPHLQVVIPTLPHLEPTVRAYFNQSAVIITTPEEKYAAYQASQAALAASGTVALELAAAGLPFIIAYKMNPLTHFIVKRLVSTKYACLVNILLNRKVVPEFLQKHCTPDNLCKSLQKIFQSQVGMRHDLENAVTLLMPPPPQESPSAAAAHQIIQIIRLI